MSAGKINRTIYTHIGKDGKQEAAANLRPSGHGECNDIPYDPRPVVPVLFLPGIMGSVLRDKASKRIVWNPGSAGFMFWNYLVTMTDKKRQQWLDPNNTEVCNEGPIDPGLLGQSSGGGRAVKDFLRKRGWGTVMNGAYHEFMALLEVRLNNMVEPVNQVNAKMADSTRNIAKNLGAQDGLQDLDEQKILDVGGRVRFEVWGGGYNWLKSNVDSAAFIKKRIDEIIDHYAKAEHLPPPAPKKVLLVTHSMGGLVARSLSLDAPDKAWGAIIGAMPANGAMDAYIRARRGTQSPETSVDGLKEKLTNFFMDRILGNDAEEISRLFAQALGALELLPFGETYNKDIDEIEVCVEDGAAVSMPDRRGQGKSGVWLHINKCAEKKLIQLPKADPYSEIYMCDDWYGLMPKESREKYINPQTMPEIDGKTFSHEEEEEECDPEMDCAGFPEKAQTYSFSDLIKSVQKFHTKVRGKYPKDSYALWSGAVGDWLTPNEVIWQVRPKVRGWMKNWRIFDSDKPKDDKKGKMTLGDNEMELFTLLAPGDQTVPQGAWWADRRAANILGHFIIGWNVLARRHPGGGEAGAEPPAKNEEKEKKGEGIGHQDFYNDSRVRDAAIYAAIQIIHKHLNDFEQ